MKASPASSVDLCPSKSDSQGSCGAGRDILAKAMTKSRMEDRYIFKDRVEFVAVQDHILESECSHQTNAEKDEHCQVCRFEGIGLPHLPEMVFPHNKIGVIVRGNSNETMIEFNAFDALCLIDKKHLPDVKVGPSDVWQNARREIPSRHCQQPFDWTYTSDYRGSLGSWVSAEEATEEQIDYERLKRRDPIQFYSQMTLYEDELSDHGCAQMTVRVRVMPETFFLLCRFYLRIDHVMVRVCDTRVYGTAENKHYALREWTRREASYSQLDKEALSRVLDPNFISPILPVVSSETTKLYYQGSS